MASRVATAIGAAPRTSGRERERGAIAGVLMVLLGGSFLTVTMLAASIAPGYDYHAAAISDLGVADETALLFNALLVGIAALNLGAGLLLYRSHRRTWILAAYLVAAIGAAGAGFVPLDVSGLHSVFALIGFVFFNVEAVATATVLRGPIRVLSVAAGVIGIIYVVVMIIGDGGNPAIFGAIGHGGSERMIVYPAMLWTLILGGYLVGGTAVPERGAAEQSDA